MSARVRRSSATEPAIDTQRQRSTRALSRLLTQLLAPAARRQGFAAVEVIVRWAKIVGAELARRCQPVKLDFQPGTRERGTLVLQAAGGAALELQHIAPQVIERINELFRFSRRRPAELIQMPSRALPAPPHHRCCAGSRRPRRAKHWRRAGRHRRSGPARAWSGSERPSPSASRQRRSKRLADFSRIGHTGM